MEVFWACLMVVLAGASRAEAVSDDLHFRAPPLFHLDDYEACLHLGDTFCMGEFELAADGNSQLLDDLRASSDRWRLNRTLVHRGLCISSTDLHHQDPVDQFQRYTDNSLQKYGLKSNLKRLDYCRSQVEPGIRPLDYSDVIVALMVVAVVLLNLVGTLYDFCRNPDEKPCKFLLAWSLRVNWRHLAAQPGGDEDLDRLAPISGVKTHQSAFVILAHSQMAMTMLYQKDARETDFVMMHPVSAFLKNGTTLVQTFVTLTNFLLAYLLLLHVKKTKKTVPLSTAPFIILGRYLKMTPTIMFVVALTATWTARLAAGPGWLAVQALEADCRDKWWTHLFYINNLLEKDKRCLIQTWFMAVDMQVFVVGVVLCLLLLPHRRQAPKVLAALYVTSLLGNLALNVYWEIKPMFYEIIPETLRLLLVNMDAYNWMFSMPWTSLPACFLGLLLAFVYHNLREDGFNPANRKWLEVASWAWFPLFLAWLWSAVAVQHAPPALLHVYSTLDKNVFNLMATGAMWLVFNNISSGARSYLSWSGFRVLGRLALSALLVHWHVNLMGLAAATQPVEVSFFRVIEFAVSSTVLTFALAVPLHLMVELPTQKLVSLIM